MRILPHNQLPSVPTLVLGAASITDLTEALDGHPLSIVDSVPAFSECLRTHRFGIVASPAVDASILSVVRALVGQHPRAQLVFVVDERPRQDRSAELSGVSVQPLEHGADRLVRVLLHSWFEGRRHWLRTGVTRLGFAVAVAGALRVLLAQHIPDSLDDPPPMRTVTELADAVSTSRSHMSVIATAENVDLAALGAHWTAILAVEKALTSDLTWEGIAWRCGFQSASGLSELLRRQFGCRLRTARQAVSLESELRILGSALGMPVED
jgi:AraC-like DNA-binding protein